MLLVARLGCADLDGAPARDTGRTTRRGALLNGLGDRAAGLVAPAGSLTLAPLWLVAVAALAAALPSWVPPAGAGRCPRTGAKPGSGKGRGGGRAPRDPSPP
ncbi:hypothetical protein ACWDZ4_09165 [Streptomyces sp. NPDC003016]